MPPWVQPGPPPGPWEEGYEWLGEVAVPQVDDGYWYPPSQGICFRGSGDDDWTTKYHILRPKPAEAMEEWPKYVYVAVGAVGRQHVRIDSPDECGMWLNADGTDSHRSHQPNERWLDGKHPLVAPADLPWNQATEPARTATTVEITPSKWGKPGEQCKGCRRATSHGAVCSLGVPHDPERAARHANPDNDCEHYRKAAEDTMPGFSELDTILNQNETPNTGDATMNSTDKQEIRQMMREAVRGVDAEPDEPRELTPEGKYPLMPFSERPECPACGSRKFSPPQNQEFGRYFSHDGTHGKIDDPRRPDARYTISRCKQCGTALRMAYKADSLAAESMSPWQYDEYLAGKRTTGGIIASRALTATEVRALAQPAKPRRNRPWAFVTAIPRLAWWLATKPEEAKEKIKGYAYLAAAGFVAWMLFKDTLPVQIACDYISQAWAMAADAAGAVLG